MARIRYSQEYDRSRTSRSVGYELNISPKDAFELSRELKGMRIKQGIELLEDVKALKTNIRIKRHKKKVSHKKNLKNWDAGRCPQKAAGQILTILKNAESNAEYSGLNTDRLFIKNMSCKKGRVTKGLVYRAFGRATTKRAETVSVQCILEEMY